MIINVLRRPSAQGATIGKLSINGVFACYCLEDQIREVEGQPVESWKIHGKTAIPHGLYTVTLENSPHFGPDTLTINNVPGYTGIRMHAGNTAADTEGCLLLGMAATDHSLMGGTSRPAVAMVKGMVKTAIDAGEQVQIMILNPGARNA